MDPFIELYQKENKGVLFTRDLIANMDVEEFGTTEYSRHAFDAVYYSLSPSQEAYISLKGKLLINQVSYQISVPQQAFISSAPFVKIYNLGDSLKKFILNGMWIGSLKEFSEFFKEVYNNAGAQALYKNEVIKFVVGEYSIYGYITNITQRIVPQMDSGELLSIDILGWEGNYGFNE